MKNITITLDEKTAAWARVEAAKLKMSVSRMIGEMLHKRMSDRRESEAARRRFFSSGPYLSGNPGQPYPKREELYERGGRLR